MQDLSRKTFTDAEYIRALAPTHLESIPQIHAHVDRLYAIAAKLEAQDGPLRLEMEQNTPATATAPVDPLENSCGAFLETHPAPQPAKIIQLVQRTDYRGIGILFQIVENYRQWEKMTPETDPGYYAKSAEQKQAFHGLLAAADSLIEEARAESLEHSKRVQGADVIHDTDGAVIKNRVGQVTPRVAASYADLHAQILSQMVTTYLEIRKPLVTRSQDEYEERMTANNQMNLLIDEANKALAAWKMQQENPTLSDFKHLAHDNSKCGLGVLARIVEKYKQKPKEYDSAEKYVEWRKSFVTDLSFAETILNEARSAE
jgi:hypothetical protein